MQEKKEKLKTAYWRRLKTSEARLWPASVGFGGGEPTRAHGQAILMGGVSDTPHPTFKTNPNKTRTMALGLVPMMTVWQGQGQWLFGLLDHTNAVARCAVANTFRLSRRRRL